MFVWPGKYSSRRGGAGGGDWSCGRASSLRHRQRWVSWTGEEYNACSRDLVYHAITEALHRQDERESRPRGQDSRRDTKVRALFRTSQAPLGRAPCSRRAWHHYGGPDQLFATRPQRAYTPPFTVPTVSPSEVSSTRSIVSRATRPPRIHQRRPSQWASSCSSK
jgi:hypothetical protein